MKVGGETPESINVRMLKPRTHSKRAKNGIAVVVMLAVVVMVIVVGRNASNYPIVERNQVQPTPLQVTVSTANVRSGPGTEHDIVAKINKDDTVVKLLAGDGWTKVRLSDSQVGWIENSLVAAEMTLASATAPRPRRSPPKQDCGDVHGAWAYMQQFVLQRLKSPKSADFPFGGYRHVTDLGSGRYRVKSYVDAQNSFGADIRTPFEGVIKRVDDGWQLESLILQE